VIRLVAPQDIPELLSAAPNSGLGTKALGPLLSYGTDYPFATTWVQMEDEKQISAVLSCFYGAMTAAAFSTLSAEQRREILSFADAAGCRSFTADAALFDREPDGLVLRRSSGGVPMQETPAVCFAEEPRSLKPVFSLLAPQNVSYDEWVVDISHRIRHGTMCVAVLPAADGAALATASALTVLPDSYLLGAVQTRPDWRGKGLAKQCISAVMKKMEARTGYLMCRDELKDFYRPLGFQPDGTFSQQIRISGERSTD